MGAYLVLFPRAHIIVWTSILFYPLFFQLPAITYLLIWFLMQVLSGTVTAAGPEEAGRWRGGRTREAFLRGSFFILCSCVSGVSDDGISLMNGGSRETG